MGDENRNNESYGNQTKLKSKLSTLEDT